MYKINSHLSCKNKRPLHCLEDQKQYDSLPESFTDCIIYYTPIMLVYKENKNKDPELLKKASLAA